MGHLILSLTWGAVYSPCGSRCGSSQFPWIFAKHFSKITQTFLGEILPHKCSKTLISCKNRKAKIVAKTPDIQRISGVLVGEGGFEPPKSLTADLQSVPFGHSGIPPYSLCCIHFETQRSGFKMKRRKAIADMELFASAESGMEQASFDGGAGRRIRTPDLLITKSRKILKISFSGRF